MGLLTRYFAKCPCQGHVRSGPFICVYLACVHIRTVGMLTPHRVLGRLDETTRENNHVLREIYHESKYPRARSSGDCQR